MILTITDSWKIVSHHVDPFLMIASTPWFEQALTASFSVDPEEAGSLETAMQVLADSTWMKPMGHFPSAKKKNHFRHILIK